VLIMISFLLCFACCVSGLLRDRPCCGATDDVAAWAVRHKNMLQVLGLVLS
jgi:hypothetical protein